MFVMNVNNIHWTTGALDFRNEPTVLWYFDPLRNAMPLPLRNLLKLYPKAVLKLVDERVQYDGVHCGVWCIAFLSKLLHFSPPGVFTMEPDYFTNTKAHISQKSNTDRILALRKTLVSLVT